MKNKIENKSTNYLIEMMQHIINELGERGFEYKNIYLGYKASMDTFKDIKKNHIYVEGTYIKD